MRAPGTGARGGRTLRIMNEDGTMRHSFALCAYGDSPYLEACLKSLRNQTIPSELFLSTSTPSDFLFRMGEKYGVPVYVNQGTERGIGADWNAAFQRASGTFVTLAHQDDVYAAHYTERLLKAADRFPDMVLFTGSALTLKNGRIQRDGTVERVKRLLRLPLRLHGAADRTEVKRLALRFGNPVVCPTCAYRKDACAERPFRTDLKFVLDWQFLYDFASGGGRWILEERPLLLYRIHDGAATKECIEDRVREREEAQMFQTVLPFIPARQILRLYRRSYETYED